MVSVECDMIFKILLLGDSSVGKSCLLLRYVEETFTENHISTIGVDYKIKLITTSNNGIIKMQIWDTAGQDRFRSITKNYYRGSNGIVLMYDITSLSSFNNIKNWMIQIKDYLGDNACIIIVGNKLDLESNRQVDTEDAMKLASDFNFFFFEVSAKDNLNVDVAFQSLLKEMIKNYSKANGDSKKGLSSGKDKVKKKQCCG